MLKTVVRYFVTLYSLSYLGAFLSIALIAVLSRVLSAEDIGKYALFGLVYSYSEVFFCYGLYRTSIKFIGQGKEDEANILLFLILFGGLVSVIIAVISFAGVFFLYDFILIAFACVIPSFFVQIFRSYFRAKFKVKKEAILIVTKSISFFLITITITYLYFLYQNNGSAPGVIVTLGDKLYLIPIIGELLSLIIVALIGLRMIHKECLFKLRDINSQEVKVLGKKMLGFSVHIWTSQLCGRMNDMVDQIAVQRLLGTAVLGEYYLAIRLSNFISKPMSILSRIFLSTFSKDEHRTKYTYNRVLSANLAIFPAVSLLVVSISPIISGLLFSDKYSQVPILFTVISFTYLFLCLDITNSSFNIGDDKPQINRKSNMVTLGVSIPLVYGLITWFSTLGAAIVKGSQRGIFVIFQLLFMRKEMSWYVKKSISKLSKTLGIYVFLCAFIVTTDYSYYSISSPFLYLFFGHVTGVFDLKELSNVLRKAIWTKKH